MACTRLPGTETYRLAGSEAGGTAAATAQTLIETAKLNAVDPRLRAGARWSGGGGENVS